MAKTYGVLPREILLGPAADVEMDEAVFRISCEFEESVSRARKIPADAAFESVLRKWQRDAAAEEAFERRKREAGERA